MTENTEPSGAQQAFGDFAPAFVGFTDDVLFGQVWPRPQLSPKERSLITVAARHCCIWRWSVSSSSTGPGNATDDGQDRPL